MSCHESRTIQRKNNSLKNHNLVLTPSNEAYHPQFA